MAVKHFKGYTPSRRNMTVSDFAEVTKKLLKNLYLLKRKNMQVETHMEKSL